MGVSGQGLNLGLIGNCCISALVDEKARVVWMCMPRFDGDPVFHGLLGAPDSCDSHDGLFTIELDGMIASSQRYLPNTAVLKTTLESPHGTIEITDFIPRFYSRDRAFRPQQLIRRVEPVSGNPRIRIRVRPRFGYGQRAPQRRFGSNHIRYSEEGTTYRLTSDAPIDYILNEATFNLTHGVNLVFGPDETLAEGPFEVARSFEEQTVRYWKRWSGRLALPLEWQEAVVRAAITLKLSAYEPTGAIVAAMTTSVPEAAHSERNWDYRFCWVRDAFFVVRALNSLAAVQTMEHYFHWIMNVVADADGGHVQPVLSVDLEKQITERIETGLPGYQGMGPVRVGNQAHEHFQHDVYGNVILGAAQAFFDQRIALNSPLAEFARLELVGEQAFRLHDKPDAGMWELRSRERVHTSSSLMCWAACDRLAKIAAHIGRADRAQHWGARADQIKAVILEQSWSEKRKAFVESFGGEHLDASVLLMGEVGMIDPHDPRFVSTVEQLGDVLGRGPFMMRYEAADDFGTPETAFNICAFWRLDALARIGRRDEAREIFEALLSCRNHVGLMSEDTDPENGVAWGNFPQTYSMVGIINGATRLSEPWESKI